ncbi:hypothetical protein DAPPUDRAFT_243976 [Daphnia pulex]|uniref:Uncharacterized protein n=1 Tax=Daphnia pulex TaxID=6669 RepID=E9GJY2_DAPPU|nr:hypothetical protein DAPPUDRAFT_243976 [Daphnia pulex]|eukprot:EFX80243.1 hypothetical protein DAPPUDRAFT_243976 [Daphnia pulex]
MAAVQQKGNPAKKAKTLSKAKTSPLDDGFSEEPDVASDTNDNYDVENELEMIYIDLGIEFDDTSITKDTDEVGLEYDFNRSTLCEDSLLFSFVELGCNKRFQKSSWIRPLLFFQGHEKARFGVQSIIDYRLDTKPVQFETLVQLHQLIIIFPMMSSRSWH